MTKFMHLLPVLLIVACLNLVFLSAPLRAEITAEQVRESLHRGSQFLRRSRQNGNGKWPEFVGQPGGITALCTLALLNAGLGVDDPDVAAGLHQLRRLGNPEKTYATSLQTMVFCAAEPARDVLLIRRNAEWLESAQATTGPYAGGWSYDQSAGAPDESNSQFALLALHEASLVGVPTKQVVWQRAALYWEKQQSPNGAWSYRGQSISGSMTCAGISSVIITANHLTFGDAAVRNGRVECCGAQDDQTSLERGMAWLARNFSVSRNPSERTGGHGTANLDYYLYGLERVGRLSGQRFIGRHDWYREGAQFLVQRQDRLSGAWSLNSTNPSIMPREVSTTMAMLFLAKGRRPVLISKVQFTTSNDWNHHRRDLANLSLFAEQKWHLPLTWQTVDLSAATLQDLLQSPVLFFTGRDGLRLSSAQKRLLLDYVNGGGFIFAEACCGGKGFEQDFRRLMSELFPDNPLRLLPPDHPVWYADEKVSAKFARPLYGVEACCRTSIVFCPGDLGCYWDMARGSGLSLPNDVQQEVDAVLRIGTNVLAYATGRELHDKLDVPLVPIASAASDGAARGALSIAKLQHRGGSDDAPAAVTNLLAIAARQMDFPVQLQRHLLPATAAELGDFPIAYVQGRRAFQWSDEERRGIRKFVENGGVVLADAICGEPGFANSFRAEMAAIFPEHPLRRIPPDHPLLSTEFRGFDIRQVRLRRPRARGEGEPVRTQSERTAPVLEGIEIDGNFVVILSPYDLSCALENHASLECLGYDRDDAARIGINLILYAMQQ